MHARAQSDDQLADLRAQVSRLYGQGKYAPHLPSCSRRLRYRHFAHAAEAMSHAIKRLPPKVLSGKSRKSTISATMPRKFMHYEGEASRADPSKEQDHAFEQWRR